MEEAVEKEDRENDLIVGFLDEASSHIRTNQRLWSFRRPLLVKNTTVSRVNILGFYTSYGNSVVDFKDNSRTDSVCSFLETIRECNPVKRILVVLDNYRPHTTEKVREKAACLDIILVFLPYYSPDLNPIEQIWKALKRQLSILFLLTMKELKEAIRQIYRILSVKTSYSKNWIDTYMIKY